MIHFAIILFEQLWMVQNKCMLESPILDWIEFTHQLLKLTVKYWKAARTRYNQRRKKTTLAEWTPSGLGTIKINVDVTFSNCKATIGIVSRDHNRRILGAWTNHFSSPNAFCVKMEVIVQALIKAEEMNMEKADIESDSLGVILALQGLKDYEDWQAEDNTKKGRHILRRQTLWNLQHINR